MSDPVRLRDEGDAFEMALLDAARDDVPGRHVSEGVHAALGLGAVVAGVSVSANAAAAGGAVKSMGAAAVLGTVKWMGACVVAGVALGATSAYVSPSRAIPAPTFARVPRSMASTANTNTNTTTTTNANASVTLTPNANATPNVSVGVVVPSSASTLLLELSPLDAARTALDSGNTGLALAQLDRHDSEFPHGQLAPETLALRVEVHAARHEDAKVRELAARFVARYPEHPQAARMRTMSKGAIP